jgi:hypothetical protein
MKRLVVTKIALVFIVVTLSTSVAQQSSVQNLGLPHPVKVRSIESANEVQPNETGVQIVVVTDDDGRMTLEMDNSTAHTLAAEIRDLEIEPYGAP